MKKPDFTLLLAETLQHFAEEKTVEQIADLYGKKPRAIRKRFELIHKHFECGSAIGAYRLALLQKKIPLR